MNPNKFVFQIILVFSKKLTLTKVYLYSQIRDVPLKTALKSNNRVSLLEKIWIVFEVQSELPDLSTTSAETAERLTMVILN